MSKCRNCIGSVVAVPVWQGITKKIKIATVTCQREACALKKNHTNKLYSLISLTVLFIQDERVSVHITTLLIKSNQIRERLF